MNEIPRKIVEHKLVNDEGEVCLPAEPYLAEIRRKQEKPVVPPSRWEKDWQEQDEIDRSGAT
jgi:hypothetical protein